MTTKQNARSPKAKMSEDVSAETQRRMRLSPQTRERMILDAAIDFFAEEGFRAQTRALADRIGVSQSLIYRYFGSKENLIERVYEKTFLSRWNPAWEETLADRSRPLRERLQEFFRSYLVAVDDRNWIRVAMHSSLEGSDLTKRYIQGHVTRLLGKIALELRSETEARKKHELSPMELELAWHLHSTVIYYLIRKHIHGTAVSLQTDDIADMIVNNFLDGVKSLAMPKSKLTSSGAPGAHPQKTEHRSKNRI
ncbi:AcrR family transcriptional regulator [Nitrobacteraceae bacterium AZCC 1564]